MILNPRSFSYPNSVSWFSWYRDARRVFPENRPGAAASQIELVISRILNRWKAKIPLVPEEAMVELICFLLRSSCLQHPSRTMGAPWAVDETTVVSWFLRISACFTHKDLSVPKYIGIHFAAMNALVWLCEYTHVNNTDLEIFCSTYVVNRSELQRILFAINLLPHSFESSLRTSCARQSGHLLEHIEMILLMRGFRSLCGVRMQHFIHICRGVPAMSAG